MKWGFIFLSLEFKLVKLAEAAKSTSLALCLKRHRGVKSQPTRGGRIADVFQQDVSRSIHVPSCFNTTLLTLKDFARSECFVLPTAATACYRRELFLYNFNVRPSLLAFGDESLSKLVMRPRQHCPRCLVANVALSFAHHKACLKLWQQDRFIRCTEFFRDIVVQLFHQVANALQYATPSLFETTSLLCSAGAGAANKKRKLVSKTLLWSENSVLIPRQAQRLCVA